MGLRKINLGYHRQFQLTSSIDHRFGRSIRGVEVLRGDKIYNY